MKNDWLHRIASYLKWRLQAKSWRTVHSPWLFELLQNMRSDASESEPIEALRAKLRNDPTPVPTVDFGAGSNGAINTVSGITRHSLKRKKHARAMAGIAMHIKAQSALELGTSLGLTTAYLAEHASQVWTMEGNPHIAELATNHWNQLDLQNIQLTIGAFDASLNKVLEGIGPIDLVFIDGNHRGDALLHYVNQIEPSVPNSGVIVCDDIHWSMDMERAWNSLCLDPKWTLKVDFYEWGLLTKNPDLKPELRCIRF